MKRLLPSLLLSACCALTAYSQTAFHTVITMEEEEGNSLHIRHLSRDYIGYLWIGTQEGLYRFDGKNFHRMDGDSVSGHSAVTALETGADGVLRAGFQSGRIGMMEHHRLETFSPQEGMPRKAITAVHGDKDGALWFAAADEGLYHRVNGKLYNINREDGLGDDYIYCITGTEDGSVIVGTDRGLSVVRMEGAKKIIRNFATAQGLPDNIVRVIEPSGLSGLYWIGMQDKGICLFDLRNEAVVKGSAVTDWRYGQVNAILPGKDRAWVATEDSGLIRLDNRGMDIKVSRDAFPMLQKVTDLARDVEGNIWLSQQGRLVRSSADQLAFYGPTGGRPSAPVRAVTNPDSGHLWTAEGNAVSEYIIGNGPPKLMRTYRFPGSGMADLTSLYLDEQGIMWIGTVGAGILRMNTRNGEWSPLSGNPVLSGGHVLSVTGKGHDVWISGLNGLTHYVLGSMETVHDAPSFTNLNKDSGTGSDYVYQVFIDSKDRVWFATDGAGISWKDEKGFHRFGGGAGSANRVVYSVTEDHEGTIWCNVLGEGLYRYDGQTFRNYPIPAGNLGSEITSIAAGPGATLVLVQKKGIDWLDTHSGRVIHYGKSSGVTWKQSNLNAAFAGPAGALWVGTDEGLMRFTPGLFPEIRLPHTLIERITLFGEESDSSVKRRFAHDENNIGFAFRGLCLTDPDQVRYEYMLEGYSKVWTNTSDNEVVFPKLPAGHYRFRVRSSLSNHFEGSDEVSWAFMIDDPFWKKWWFILGAALLLVGALYVMIRQRERSLQRWERVQQEKIRSELDTLKSQVNPHFLFNSFNTLINVIEDDPDKGVKYAEKLSSFYRSMLSYRETELIPLREELELLQTYVYLQQQRFGDALRYTVDLPKETLDGTLIPPLALQLLAENAFKHNAISRETPLHLEVLQVGDSLIVRNNINKKRNPESGEGVGLENIANRYALLVRKKTVAREAGGFFIVELPLIKKNDHAHPAHRR